MAIAINRTSSTGSSALAGNTPKQIQNWMNRMPTILLPGEEPQTTDRLRLGQEWESPPKSVTLGGKTYPVKNGMAEVPMFDDQGKYPATVTLENGKNVPVTFKIDFAF
jgi:hypothetical protein